MSTQVSFPGIYIQGFAPQPPIQGVSTSIGCFIGTASMGPINTPTMITSWDQFQNVFGGFINEPSNSPNRSWLAPAVYGFFLNQGTNCYILRTADLSGGATSLMASVPITVQPPSTGTALIATAIAEGTIGNSITVTVSDSSRLATMLGAAGPTLATAAAVVSNQLTFNVVLPATPNTFVLSQALPAGALIEISGGGNSEFVTVASTGISSIAGQGTITVTTGLIHNYAAGATIASFEFTLVVTGATTETWPQLSMNSQHPGYWQTVVQSQMITLSLPATPPTYPAPPTVPNPNPAAGAYALTAGANDNRVQDMTDLNANPTKYLNLLAPIQNIDLVAIPGNVNANAQQALVTHCETLFNRFAVLDGVQDTSPGFPNLLAQYGQVRTTNGFAAIYFPWIQVVNPLTGVTEYWPPSGAITGCIAQTDNTIGVYKAPANVPIAGALGLQSQLANADQGPLNLLGINCLRVFPEQSQPLIWGARTTSTDSSWQYINVRRLFIYIEQSLEQGLRPFLFQPNNNFLWGSMTRTITEFLNRLMGTGIINFYVKINATNNPPSVQALGQLYAEVGIQPAYPAEFIILKIGIWDGGSSVTES